MAGEAELLDLQRALGAQVTEVLECALRVESAGECPPAWAAVLERLHVARAPADAREEALRTAKQTRGAVAPEVRACLASVIDQSRAALAQVPGLDPDARLRADASLAGLVDLAMAHYRQRTAPRPRASMFAHVLETASTHNHSQYGSGYVLHCSNCGGAQFDPSNFNCPYCGSAFHS